MTQPLPAIRRDLRFTPHLQHRELWYAVEDPSTGRFLRMGRQEYLAAMQFDGGKDARAVKAAAKENDPSFKLNETEIGQLQAWLSRVGFLINPHASNTQRSPSTPHSSRSLWDPLGARFPLIRGTLVEQWARRLLPLVSLPCAIGVAVLAVLAGATVVANWSEFFEYTSKLFVAEGRIWWIVAWLLLKMVHELGHAVTAVRAGSQIRSAGVSMFFFAPVPYIDVSDLWSISNRWQRILCSAGGILFEIAVASLAVFVAFTAENESLRYLACAVATTGTITTLAFNANPFTRFDGYYILSDLLQRPNLWSDGQAALKGFVRRAWHPLTKSPEPMQLGMLAYGLTCAFYRFAMLMGVALWALIVWQAYGLIIIGWASYAWFLAPFLKARKAAQTAAAMQPVKAASTAWWQPVAVTAVVALALFLPSPVQPSVPGIVTLREPTIIRSASEGTLVAVYVNEMDKVEIGTLIAEFDNPHLMQTLAMKQLEVATAIEMIAVMRARSELASLQAEQAKLTALNEQLMQLQRDVSELDVRAEAAGTVLANDLKRQLGRFFKPGEPLTMIAQPNEMEIKLSASQQDHQSLRNSAVQTIRIASSGNRRYRGVIEKIDWRGSDTLDEPALAATYGGPIAVEIGSKSTDKEGLKLPAPRFEVHVKMDLATSQGLVPGQLVWARIPNSSASLFELFQRWLGRKWEAAKLENAAT